MHESTYFIIDLSICVSIVLNKNIFQNRILVSQKHLEAGQNFQLYLAVYHFLIFLIVFYIRQKMLFRKYQGQQGEKKESQRITLGQLSFQFSTVTASIHVAAHYTLHIQQKQTHPKPQIQGKKYNKGKGHFYSFSSVTFLLQ